MIKYWFRNGDELRLMAQGTECRLSPDGQADGAIAYYRADHVLTLLRRCLEELRAADKDIEFAADDPRLLPDLEQFFAAGGSAQ